MGTAIQNKKDMRNIKLIRELKKGERVNVKISPMCIFLFRDGAWSASCRLFPSSDSDRHPGTVVTMHQDTKLDFTQPITDRLRQRDTGLRTTADASLLVESLIDLGMSTIPLHDRTRCKHALVVDRALQVVEEYHSKILKLEQAVLLKPSMKHVRRCMYFINPASYRYSDVHSAHSTGRSHSPQAYSGADQDSCLWPSPLRRRPSGSLVGNGRSLGQGARLHEP